MTRTYDDNITDNLANPPEWEEPKPAAAQVDDDGITAWLGDTADTLTVEQRERFDQAVRAITQRWTDPDDADTRERAMSAALQVILGDDTLEDIAAAWRRARVAEQEAHAAMTGALIASDGSEVSLAGRAQVTRLTVRKALGK